MKTLNVTEGRARLGHWLKRAAGGEDIGFVIGDKVVALRPVGVHSDDHFLRKYGVTSLEMPAVSRRIDKRIAEERRRGTIKPFAGNVLDLCH